MQTRPYRTPIRGSRCSAPEWRCCSIPSLRCSRLTALKAYPRNARTHSKKQIRQIARSIERFGFINPVLIDESNQIIAGHGRVAAARELGLPEVPTLRLSPPLRGGQAGLHPG